MLLGKRPRPRQHPPMRRTASMVGIVPAATTDVDPPNDSVTNPVPNEGHGLEVVNLGMHLPRNINYGGCSGAPSSSLSGGGYERDASTPHFLETCGLCKRRLFPGRDIYMYRGETAFCSLECREQLIQQEERKARHNPNPCSTKPDGIHRTDG